MNYQKSSVVTGPPVQVSPDRWGKGIWKANREREAKQKASDAISQSRSQQREQALATAWARGRRLTEDGYRIRPTSIAYCWCVERPGGRRTPAPEGGTVESYTVKFDAGDWVCDCPFCSLHGLCKHLVGVKLYLSACAAALSPAFDFTTDLERLGLQGLAQEVSE